MILFTHKLLHLPMHWRTECGTRPKERQSPLKQPFACQAMTTKPLSHYFRAAAWREYHSVLRHPAVYATWPFLSPRRPHQDVHQTHSTLTFLRLPRRVGLRKRQTSLRPRQMVGPEDTMQLCGPFCRTSSKLWFGLDPRTPLPSDRSLGRGDILCPPSSSGLYRIPIPPWGVLCLAVLPSLNRRSAF